MQQVFVENSSLRRFAHRTENAIGGCSHECTWTMSDGQVAICYAKELAESETDTAVENLVAIARSNRDRETRQQAMFSLGQMENPNAMDFFDEVLAED